MDVTGADGFKEAALRLQAVGRQNFGSRVHKAVKPEAEATSADIRARALALKMAAQPETTGTAQQHASAARKKEKRGKPEMHRHVTASHAATKRKPHPSRTRGLRDALAKAVRVDSSDSGVVIRIAASLLPDSVKTLPKAIDHGSWKHQTFGRKPTVTQSASPALFTQPISGHRRAFEDAAKAEVEAIAREAR